MEWINPDGNRKIEDVNFFLPSHTDLCCPTTHTCKNHSQMSKIKTRACLIEAI